MQKSGVLAAAEKLVKVNFDGARFIDAANSPTSENSFVAKEKVLEIEQKRKLLKSHPQKPRNPPVFLYILKVLEIEQKRKGSKTYVLTSSQASKLR